MQEIADCLKGVDVELWIKNPIISDIKLWSGAIERFQNIKIQNIKAIHRGFYCGNELTYRNQPKWGLLKEFKNMHPEIPIVCDPSHIAGNKIYILEIIQQAYANCISKFMIEVHNSPQQVLSDRNQQISPNEFKNLLQYL